MLSNNQYHISDYSGIKLPNGRKFNYLEEYSDETWLLVQMQIDENARERERQEKKAERDFKLALIFLSCLGVLSLSFLIGVITSSFVAVSNIQQTYIEQNQ